MVYRLGYSFRLSAVDEPASPLQRLILIVRTGRVELPFPCGRWNLNLIQG